MQEHQTTRDRPTGQTTGTDQRGVHRVSAPVTILRLHQEAETLRGEPAWQQGDRNARTFAKEGDLRVVLVTMKSGAILKEHQAPGTAVVQALTGHILLHVSGESVNLQAGELVILEAGLPHDVEAMEESAFTITMGWSADIGTARG